MKYICKCRHPEQWHELDNGACHGELGCLCQAYSPIQRRKDE